jgi:uncharacterized cupredoxin-like copper-binding protein
MRRLRALLLAVSFVCGAAWAHGDDPHAANPGAGTLSPVQHAFGRQGDPKKATRTVTIDMSDRMRFTPDAIAVAQGDTVRFVVANKGEVLHEMVIGTEADLAKHAELMKKHPGMEHGDPWMVHVKAGGREEFTWQFTRPGTFAFACLVPGHYEAGMRGRIVVSARAGAK